MKKNMQLAIRMPKSMKDALQKEALKEGRTMSNMAFKILSDWLAERKKKMKEPHDKTN